MSQRLKDKLSIKNAGKIFQKYLTELKTLEKESNRLRQDELDNVFNPMTDARNNLSLANEHFYNFKVKDTDVSINIALNLVSFSLALLIAFITIPQLGGNWVIVLIPLLLSTTILIWLIFYRRKQSIKLTLTYMEGIMENIRRLSERSEMHLTYSEEQSKAIKKRLQELIEQIKKDEKILISKETKRKLDLLKYPLSNLK